MYGVKDFEAVKELDKRHREAKYKFSLIMLLDVAS